MHRVLILGGTREARQLAEALSANAELEVITSLAGRTSEARQPPGRIRNGGFGGVQGLVDYLQAEGIDALIDSTHPFAAEITRHASEAAKSVGLPFVILDRPVWSLPDDLIVHRVPDLETAAFALTALDATRVLVTVGHRNLDKLRRFDGHLVVRQIEAHQGPLPLDDAVRILDRPPYTLAHERALLDEHRIDALLTKESGGSSTEAKLEAARMRGIPVVMIERPVLPDAPVVDSVEAACAWVGETLAT